MEVVKHLQQELQEMHRKQGAEDVLKQQQEAAMRQLEGDYNQLQTKYEELKTERGGNSAGAFAMSHCLRHARLLATVQNNALMTCASILQTDKQRPNSQMSLCLQGGLLTTRRLCVTWSSS